MEGTRILVDPGSYSVQAADFGSIDAVLISHGHLDHLDVGLLKNILVKNSARVITNQDAADSLKAEGIEVELIKNGETKKVNGVIIKAFGEKHEPVYSTLDAGSNTAFLINQKLFLPGDSYTDPKTEIEILALAVSGPWVKLSEAIDYALKLKPRIAIPVHDGNMTQFGAAYSIPEKVLSQAGIEFLPLEIDKTTEI